MGLKKKYLCNDYVGKQVRITYNFGSCYNQIGIIKKEARADYTHLIYSLDGKAILAISDKENHKQFSWEPVKIKLKLG